MRYRLLGKSGLRVSELCLGTMTFGEDWGWGASREESRKIFDAYVSRGGNFIDTANAYTNGTSESFVGELVAAERGRYVVATKYTLSQRHDDPNAGGNHRKNMVQSVEGSLRRLGTDYVDLLYVHAWDGLTPVDEMMRGLDDLVRAGKVLYVGVSDTPAWVVAQANTMAELRGWSRFAGLQIEYSLVERTGERDLLPMAQAMGISVLAWGALGSGILSGKFTSGTGDDPKVDSKRGRLNASRFSERNLAIAEEVRRIAAEIDRTPSQVALAWARQQPCPIIPILGARTIGQVADNLGCLDVILSPEQVGRLSFLSAIEPGFPHDFLGQETIRRIIHGTTTVDR